MSLFSVVLSTELLLVCRYQISYKLVCLSSYHIFSERARFFYFFVEPSTAGWVAMFLIDRILLAVELNSRFIQTF